jgi:adenosylmethionine-8-amino-7-oxononanoate aminotransferase
MALVEGHELVLEHGDGAWVEDSAGTRYLDATAGLWYCNVGHGRTQLADAARDQMARLAAYQTFDVFANTPALELAERVCQLARLGDGSVAFFVSGGSDAVDTAAKIARRLWLLLGEPQRRTIVAREGAYHGMNAYGTSLAGIEANASGWGPLVREVVHVPHDSLAGLEEVFRRRGGKVAAFIGEPVQGAGGVRPPAEGYWQGVNDLCREYEVLLIADEVVTGFGRLGHWFGAQRYGIQPDMIIAAKGITSGYMPLGAVIVSERVRHAFWKADAGPFRHGYTYSGHPAACAVALENLRIIEREGLIDRVRALEADLARSMEPLAAHPLVHEVRLAGLLAGIELTEESRIADPGVVDRVVLEARKRGVLVRDLVGRTLQVSPPFVISSEELTMIARTVGEALDAVRREATTVFGSSKGGH